MNYYNLLSILTWFYHISEYRWDQLKYPWVLIRAACFSLGTRYILLYLPTHQNTFFVGLLPHSHNNQELPGLLLEDPLEYREQSLIKQSELRNWKIAIKRILQVDQDGNAKELTLVAGVINVFQYKTIIHLSRFMTSLTFNIELQWKGRICQLHSSKSWLNSSTLKFTYQEPQSQIWRSQGSLLSHHCELGCKQVQCASQHRQNSDQ